MNSRRLFQVATALFAILFSLVLFAVSVLIFLPIFVPQIELGGIFEKLRTGLYAVIANYEFIPEGWLGLLAYLGVAFLFPSFLFLLGAIILITKPKKSQGKYVFADLLVLLGAGLMAGLFEMHAKIIIPDESAIAWMIGVGTGAGLLLLLVLISLICKAPKQPVQEQPPVVTESEIVTPQEPVVVETPVEQQPVQEEPVNDYFTPRTPGTEYIPHDGSVAAIMEHTYGKTSESISDKNLKKIQTLRSLLDAHAITKDEYIALVDAYLKEN